MEFEEAVKVANEQLPEGMPNDDKLELYALYKQATVGDVNTSRPGLLDQKGRYKWDAWEKKKGLPQTDAKIQYAQKVEALKAQHGTK